MGKRHLIIKQRLSMSFVICEKHNKVEKAGSKVPANSFICMNRFCPQAFTIFCLTCKADHRDHSIKVLNIEDLSFLTDRLLKTPFMQVGGYVGEAVDLMKKLKLIKEFRRKIEVLEREIQKEALRLIDSTESLIHEYAACKAAANNLQDKLMALEQPQAFKELIASSKQLLENLDYNVKKDRLEYGNTFTREGEQRRKKTADHTRHKIEEVKDYCMKIIEVILQHGNDSSEEDDIASTKKHYELLKAEIYAEKSELQLQSEISELKNSKSTANRSSRLRRGQQSVASQTSNEILCKEQVQEEMEHRLNQMRHSHMRVQNDLRLKISIIAKQKDTNSKEINKFKSKLEEKKRQIGKIQAQLRKNLAVRKEEEKQRIEVFQHIIQLTRWKGLSLEDRYD